MSQLIPQIQAVETTEAVRRADEIASVDGIDVLFIGPLDLSVSMGIPQNYGHPDFLAALVPSMKLLDPWMGKGYTFLVVGSDGGLISSGLKDAITACRGSVKARVP